MQCGLGVTWWPLRFFDDLCPCGFCGDYGKDSEGVKCSVIPHEGLPKPKGIDEEDEIRIPARQDVMESAPCSSSYWFSHKVMAMVPWK